MKNKFLSTLVGLLVSIACHNALICGQTPASTLKPLKAEFRVKSLDSIDKTVSIIVTDEVNRVFVIPKDNEGEVEVAEWKRDTPIPLPGSNSTSKQIFTIIGETVKDGKKVRLSTLVAVQNGQLASLTGGEGPAGSPVGNGSIRKLMLPENDVARSDEYTLRVRTAGWTEEEVKKAKRFSVTVDKQPPFLPTIDRDEKGEQLIKGLRLLPGDNVIKVSALDDTNQPISGLAAETEIKCLCQMVEITSGGFAPTAPYQLGIRLATNGWSESDKSRAGYLRVLLKGRPLFKKIERDASNAIKPNQMIPVGLDEGANNLQVDVFEKDTDKNPMLGFTAEAVVHCEDACEPISRGKNTRLIAGFDQSGSSSSHSRTQPFLNLFVNIPLNQRDVSKSAGFSFWADFRLASTSIQKFANLASIASNPLTAAGEGKVNDIVQSFKATVGIDFRLLPDRNAINSYFLPGRSSLSAIFGAGTTSPFSGERNAGAEIYKIPTQSAPGGATVINPEFKKLFDDVGIDLSNKSNIAFVTPERDRFLRRYYGGLRIKHLFYKNGVEMELSPAQFDLTIGQDESVTRKLSGGVLGFEGFTPIPYKPVEFLYLYGGVSTQLKRKAVSQAPKFFLDNAPQSELNDPNKTVLIPNDHPQLFLTSRDTYFFGIGVDLARIFRGTRPIED